MKLFETIDALLLGTKYLSWGIALAGIALSVVLFFANLSLGLASAMVFVAAFLLSVGVTLLLLPKTLGKGPLANGKHRLLIGAGALVLATVLMGIVYFSIGGFPALNLLFL